MSDLVKSVETRESKPGFPWMTVFGTTFALSLLVNLFSVSACRDEQKQHQYFADDWVAADREGKILRQENDGLRARIDALTDRYRYSYALATVRGSEKYLACRKDPSGIVLTADDLRMDGGLRIDNLSALETPDGGWFLPGQRCALGDGATIAVELRVLGAGDRGTYILRPFWHGDVPPYDASRSCPKAAYQLVAGDDEITHRAVSYACLRAAKAEELSLAPH